MKKIFKKCMIGIIMLSAVLTSCSKKDSGEEVVNNQTIVVEQKTPTLINLKIRSFQDNFNFQNVQIWVTDKSIYTNDVAFLPTSTLEKIDVSTEGKASFDTEKYIGKRLYFNVFRVEGTKISLHPTPKTENNRTTNKDTDSYSFVPVKNVEVSTTLIIR